MNYRYVKAWRVNGGFTLPSGGVDVVLLDNEKGRFVVTSNPNPYLEHADRANVVASSMLARVFQQGSALDEAEIERHVLGEQGRRGLAGTFLIFEGFGDTPYEVGELSRDLGSFVLDLGSLDKKALIAQHRDALLSLMAAFVIEGETLPRLDAIGEGLHLTHSDGRPVYNVTISASGEMYVSKLLVDAMANLLRLRIAKIDKHHELRSIFRLLAQATGDDMLRAFLAGWNALEMLIGKAFVKLEVEFFTSITEGDQPELRKEFEARIREVMSQRYRLTDRFIVSSVMLLPAQSKQAAQEDLALFKRLKKIRDGLSHGDEIDDKELPVSETASLLLKYIRAYVDRIA